MTVPFRKGKTIMSHHLPDAPVSLGLGLLSIGRAWGYQPGEPPAEDEAVDLLSHAVARGITFFDTAPAYAASERIFGRFLKSLGASAAGLTIGTKMGEHWDADRQSGFVDHSYEALCRSLDRSLKLLGRIDVLQIHKATVEALASKEVARAIDYARSTGITKFGASVSDLEAARTACGSGRFSHIQFPYNRLSVALEPAFGMARQAGMSVLVNRPFAMGRLIHDGSAGAVSPLPEALAFILRQPFEGVILTGTRSKRHLDESLSAFEEARAGLSR